MLQKNKYDFSDFSSISPETWKARILAELSSSSEEAMQWETNGLTLNAFYTREDLKKRSYLEDFHSHFVLKSPRHWYNREMIHVSDIAKANVEAKILLEKGVDALEFDLRQIALSDTALQTLLKSIPLSFSPVHFYTNTSPIYIVKSILDNQLYDMKGSLRSSLLTEWMDKKDFTAFPVEEFTAAIRLLEEVPRYRLLPVDSSYFYQKENCTKEIAYSLALALDYTDRLTKAGSCMKEVLSQFEFSFSIGKNYFIEIARLRAFRFLWKKISDACSTDFESFSTPVHCICSTKDFSKEDPYQNLLQNTTAAMAAILGGCDSLTIPPFDEKGEVVFTSRISRNISLILKEEAYFDKIADPAGGSYYIEYLTDEIIRKSWTTITEIENSGGFIKAWEKGDIR